MNTRTNEDDEDRGYETRQYDKGWDDGHGVGLKTGHKLGYASGYAAAVTNAKAGGGKPGRPPKYPWSKLEQGQAMIVPETDHFKVYRAGKKWSTAQRQGHRFRVQPHTGGTLIKRVDGWSQMVDGDIVVLDNPDYEWIG